MFKRINSNVDPDATVVSEVRKEFKKYFDLVMLQRNRVVSEYPKQIFASMMILIAISLIVCFIIRTPSEMSKETMPKTLEESTSVPNQVTGGIGQILDLGSKISQVNKLRKQVNEILLKPKLNHADTVFLENAIIQLEQNNKKLKDQNR